jgi:two-component system, cell cycle sensor histidine kinase and response regulator CckA
MHFDYTGNYCWEVKDLPSESEHFCDDNPGFDISLSGIQHLTKALQQKEATFFKFFHNSANMAVLSTVKEGLILDLNQEFADFLGFKPKDIIGLKTTEFGLWNGPQERNEILELIKKEGKAQNVKIHFTSQSKGLCTALFSIEPVVLDKKTYLLSTIVDISERERETEALRKSEEKYRNLIESLIQGLYVIQDNCFVLCNRSFASMTGYSVEELLSFPDSILLVHPDDRELVCRRQRERIAGKNPDQRHRHRIVRKDGAVRWLEVSASRIEYNGSTAVQIASMDITESKQTEEALQESEAYLNKIINCMGDAIIVKDRQRKIIMVNDYFCAGIGLQRKELLGKTTHDFLPKEKADKYQLIEERVLSSGEENMIEDESLDSTGKTSTFLSKIRSFTAKNGDKCLLTAIRDITEFKQLQSQFLQAQKMEALGALAGGVAHDFNNLLNVINGYSDLILEELDPNNSIRTDLAQIRSAGQRAASLTSQLLAFGRKQMIQPEILNLNEAMEDICKMLSRLISESIKLTTFAQPDLWPIRVDHGQLHQIIMNLAINARDAMPGGGQLTIETANVILDENYIRNHPATTPGAYVMLAVSDSGIGMDAETRAHVFEPFFTTKEKGKGTGLGLSTVYGIVKQNKGFIWVDSELGKGTAFKIYFPHIEGKSSKKLSKTKKSEISGSETILIVEDDAAGRLLAGRILRDRGYTTIEAADGFDALRLAKDYEEKIHLILTDAVMPGMGGKELVERMKALRPGIRALYASGYSDAVIIQRGILDKDIAFLQKPYEIACLIQKVRDVLDANN